MDQLQDTALPDVEASPAERAARAARLRPDIASDECRARAAGYFSKGWGHVRVAQALNLKPNTVRQWRRDYRAGRFNVSPACYVYGEDFKRQVVDMRRSGATWRKIKSETGISSATVRRWMAKEEAQAERPAVES